MSYHEDLKDNFKEGSKIFSVLINIHQILDRIVEIHDLT